MVKCQQRLEFMRIYRISFHMSLYQLIPAVKENKKGIAQMPNVKYTDSATFRCLENLKEGSLISVRSIRAKNTARPDISVPCQEMSSSSILCWTVLDSILPEVRPGALLPDRCL